jgi:uncharacterized membrane protein
MSKETKDTEKTTGNVTKKEGKKPAGVTFFASGLPYVIKEKIVVEVDNPNTIQKGVAWFFLGLAAVTAPVALGYLTANHGDNWSAVAEKFGHGQEGVMNLSCILAAIGILGIASLLYLCFTEDKIEIEIQNPRLPADYVPRVVPNPGEA